MYLANILNDKLNRQEQKSLLITTTKEILKTPAQKLKKTVFSFKRTNKAESKNSKILVALNGNLNTAIAEQNDSPLNYGSEFRNTTDLATLFYYHEDKSRVINIIQQGPLYHVDPGIDIMILRGYHEASHSEMNSKGLDKAIIKEVDHEWALPLTIRSLQQQQKTKGSFPCKLHKHY